MAVHSSCNLGSTPTSHNWSQCCTVFLTM